MERKVELDYLKVIGIIMIILAHVCNNVIVYKFRNFDVILLIMISGILVSNKQFDSKKEVLEYYKKRFFKIIFPTWIFLLILFTGNYFANFWNLGIEISVKDIIDSFIFTNDGIRYTWIIRVFTFTALFTPLLCNMKKKMNYKIYWSIMLGLYLLYSILLKLNVFNNIQVINLGFNYIVPYVCIIFSLGLYTSDIKKNKLLVISLINIAVYIILEVILKVNTIEGMKSFKYPPSLYYLTYGIGISLLLYYFFKYIINNKLRTSSIISYISKNSLYLYFIHIPFLQLTSKIEEYSIIRFFIVLGCSLVTLFVIKNIERIGEKYEVNYSNSLLQRGRKSSKNNK
ncbi:MAG: acyltransferase [Clostridia bacterium]|nr:acyltransferase [Clostridia bacterium]